MTTSDGPEEEIVATEPDEEEELVDEEELKVPKKGKRALMPIELLP